MFLPQMASANDQLRNEMDNTPVQEFDIEHIDPSTENVIEMVNILFLILFFFFINVQKGTISLLLSISTDFKNNLLIILCRVCYIDQWILGIKKTSVLFKKYQCY